MSTSKLFDVHTHIQFAAFKDDADTVIRRALDAGVWMINVGTQKDTSARAVEFANKYPEGVYATVGLHPIHTERSYHDEKELGSPNPPNPPLPKRDEEEVLPPLIKGDEGGFYSRGEEFDYEYYKKLAEDPKVVAIGECGLDYYRIKNQESRIKQEKTFMQQIELAAEIKKPLMIHCRSAFTDLIRILNSCFSLLVSPPGVIHFFSGSKEDARRMMDLGFSFSFGGVITFTHDYDEVVKYIPLERILLETDAPYVAPAPYRGKRNEPLYVEEVAKRLAEIKSIGLEEISSVTTDNARGVFGV